MLSIVPPDIWRLLQYSAGEGPGMEDSSENARTQTLPFNTLWTGADRNENKKPKSKFNLLVIRF